MTATAKTPKVSTPRPRKSTRKPREVVYLGNRESWLTDVMEEFRESFSLAGAPLPEKVRVSVGFSSKGKRSKVIGECWYGDKQSDGVPQVFVHPKLSSSAEAGTTLVHELVHAAGRKGHGRAFAQVASALGLEAPWTATPAGPELLARLAAIVARIGAYPHSGLNEGSSAPPKQSTRMLKLQCLECEMIFRTTATGLERSGLPTCGCGGEVQRA